MISIQIAATAKIFIGDLNVFGRIIGSSSEKINWLFTF